MSYKINPNVTISNIINVSGKFNQNSDSNKSNNKAKKNDKKIKIKKEPFKTIWSLFFLLFKMNLFPDKLNDMFIFISHKIGSSPY